MNTRICKLSLALACCLFAATQARSQIVVRQDTEAPLTNSSVVKLVRAGFRERTLVTLINTRPVRFDLTPDRLIELKKGGVSEKIILAMIARQDGAAVGGDDGDDWGSDEDFFKGGNARNGGANNGAAHGDNPGGGESGIFGSSSGARNRSRSSVGGQGNSGDSQTSGNATVRILRPPAETGDGATPKLEKTPTLTNDSIVELVEAGFSEGTIIRRIEQSPVEFNLAPAKLAELRRRRVTEPIIGAMKSAMEDESAPSKSEK